MNLILCGYMGCGKTTVGRELAKMTGRKLIDTDAYIEQKEGMTVSEIFDAQGEDAFRGMEMEACQELSKKKDCIFSVGGGLLTNPDNCRELKTTGKIVFLDVPFEVVEQRLEMDASRPLFRNRERAQALFLERLPMYRAAADFIVDANQSIRQTALEILREAGDF